MRRWAPAGFPCETESVLSILVGGIRFETPPSATAGKPAPEKSVFTLFDNREAAMAPPMSESERYALYFHESLRGLSVGAPVTMLGLPVGEVTEVSLDYVPETQGIRTRVEVMTFQYRVFRHLGKTDVATFRRPCPGKNVIKSCSGLSRRRACARNCAPAASSAGSCMSPSTISRTRRRRGSTGQRNLRNSRWFRGKWRTSKTQLKSLLAKFDKVPVEEIGNDLKKTLETLDKTLQSADRTLTRVDAETLPEAKKTLEDLRRAITAAERVLSSTDNTLLGPDAPAQQELRDALQEIARSARAIRLLADYLERNPETLLRGKNKENP